ncbi:DUF2959 domain-containing protein [Psychrosphaera haliotis]|uniref:DUF2959 family protein n=1 Tax=Psychrosphaera haliotis TaxID=555083 RepID=A0A6N8F8J2_9GAMM|nr:DUF2959 family protein [Psychrosphaera haliotis]
MKTLTVISTLILLSACQSAYYAAMEKVGVHKREILVDRVEEARDAQTETQEEFKSAYERLVLLTNFEGGEIEKVYNQLNDDYESSFKSAALVSKKIDDVEDVAEDLFDEWQEELTQYSNANLRSASEKKLKQTERQFSQLLRSMRRAESKMDPILATLKDNVLYLKHNLNAAAVSAIKGEFDSLKTEISALIADMGKAVDESNQFIATLKK